MKIHAHLTCWNEQPILPFTLAHYSSFCDKIFVYDQMSTDMSPFICTDFPGVDVTFWESKVEKGKLNDNETRWIKHDSYIEHSRGEADWVILHDCDEFIYHPNIVEVLERYKREGVNYPIIQGCEMVSEEFPSYTENSQITDLIKTGVKHSPFPIEEIYTKENGWGFSKPIVFNPDLEVLLSLGSHFIVMASSDTHKFVFSEEAEIKCLHYKYLSEEYVLGKYKNLRERLSSYNIENEYSLWWAAEEEVHKKAFQELLKEAKVVI